MTSTMNALQLTKKSPESTPSLSLVTVPVPVPKEGEVLVKVKASLINPSDLINVKGGFPYTTFPRIVGRDFAGEIVEPASKKGRRVFGTPGNVISFTQDGVHAEYLVIKEDLLAPTPSGLTDIQASTVGTPYTAAWVGMKRASLAKGESVLIIGSSGAVGSAASRVASGWGCKVIPAARNLKSGDGVDLVADPAFKRALELTSGRGVDVIFDTVGSPDVLTKAVEVLAVNGRLAFISAPRTGSTGWEIDLLKTYRKNHSIIGTNTLVYSPEDLAPILRQLAGMFEKGEIGGPTGEGLTSVDLEGGLAAYDEMRQGTRKKFVIVMG